LHSLWFDPTGNRTHDLPHSMRAECVCLIDITSIRNIIGCCFFICKYMLYKQINKQTNKHILPPYLWSFSYEHSLTLLLYCPCLCSRSLCGSVGYLELFKVTVCNVALFACFCLAYGELFISVWLIESNICREECWDHIRLVTGLTPPYFTRIFHSISIFVKFEVWQRNGSYYCGWLYCWPKLFNFFVGSVVPHIVIVLFFFC
jgi:hypothetical protein